MTKNEFLRIVQSNKGVIQVLQKEIEAARWAYEAENKQFAIGEPVDFFVPLILTNTGRIYQTEMTIPCFVKDIITHDDGFINYVLNKEKADGTIGNRRLNKAKYENYQIRKRIPTV